MFITVPANTLCGGAFLGEVHKCEKITMWLNSTKLVAVVMVLIRNLSGEPGAAGQVGSLPDAGVDADRDGG